MKRQYLLGGQAFLTKKAVIDKCRQILYGNRIDEAAAEFLLDLIKNHPEVDIKTGAGIRRFYVGADGFGGTCFWLERSDGSSTDWSFRACLNAPTHEQQVRSGFRRAVAHQVVAHISAAYVDRSEVECAISGALVNRNSAHVDHRPPDTFLSLVDRFLLSQQLSYADIIVNSTADGSTTTEIADPHLRSLWQAFHQAHARLQITTAKANLSQGGRK